MCCCFFSFFFIELKSAQKLVASLESALFKNYEDDKQYTNQARRILMNFKAEKNDLWQRFLKESMSHGLENIIKKEHTNQNTILM